MVAGEPTTTSRRRYRSPRREQQAARTREAVLSAATELFARRGWAGTGMREVATVAGVSVETVYAGFGSKVDLLLAAVDAGVVGDADPVALADRPEFAALGAGDPAQRTAAVARLAAGIHQRTAGLQLALREAAAADSTVALRLRDLEERRRGDVTAALELVAGRPLTARERDGLWAVGTVEVYRLLTEQAGWSSREYEAWLTDLVLRVLRPAPVRQRTA